MQTDSNEILLVNHQTGTAIFGIIFRIFWIQWVRPLLVRIKWTHSSLLNLFTTSQQLNKRKNFLWERIFFFLLLSLTKIQPRGYQNGMLPIKSEEVQAKILNDIREPTCGSPKVMAGSARDHKLWRPISWLPDVMKYFGWCHSVQNRILSLVTMWFNDFWKLLETIVFALFSRLPLHSYNFDGFFELSTAIQPYVIMRLNTN